MTAATETGAGLEARVRNLVHGALFAEEGHWADSSPLLDRVMKALGPVLDEMEADRAKLAAVATRCEQPLSYAITRSTSEAIVPVADILAIISSEEES